MNWEPTDAALDLFAGTGWGVACRRLGIREMGVDNMPEVVATRAANGMATIYEDVWAGLELGLFVPRYRLLIASPPCQTFSVAGGGAGRRALDEVLLAVHEGLYKDPAALRRFGEVHDMRTALVLAPLAHVWRDRPEFVAFEQVPTVLPVWEACAAVMRSWGYSVKTAVLNAEQYGVPQTRRRAFLVARAGGPVSLPTPTHSRYYSRTPSKLDPGVIPWVSMAEALGWAGDRERRVFCPTNMRPHAAYRDGELPAGSLAFGHETPRWITEDELADYRRNGTAQPGVKLDIEEVSVLQSYPSTLVGFPRLSDGGEEVVLDGVAYRARDLRSAGAPSVTVTEKARSWRVFRNGNQANSAVRELDRPAPTIHFGARSNKVEWMADAATAADPVASGRRVSVEEAAALQTFEPPFQWRGSKTKIFLQIGNAVPPLLAEAVLRALLPVDA